MFMKSRIHICLLAVGLFALPCVASDNGAAMLYVKGTAWLNGSAIPDSSAIFPDDMVQTKPGAAASITVAGSNVAIGSASLVRYEPNHIELQHGEVTVVSSGRMAVNADEVTIAPSQTSSTEFDVRESDGEVFILAQKGTLTVSDSSGTVTLPEGQQAIRGKKKKRKKGGAWSDGNQGILGTTQAKAVGIGAVGAIIYFSLRPDDDAVSPWRP